MKRLTILGSTGSIGVSTLDVVRNHPDRFQIHALVAGRNVVKLAEQIRHFRPKIAVLLEKSDAEKLKSEIYSSTEIRFGFEAMSEVAIDPSVDLVVSAIVGAAGLRPTHAALQAGKTVALVNKESLVAAGTVMKQAEKMGRAKGAKILPVDSEHSAIHQVLRGTDREIAKIILTASGGPFRQFSLEQLSRVTKAEALKHPNWNMGAKITIDSATMMNKGLEFIEAHWLFDMPPSKIEILIHPQSIIHSMVEMIDGSVLAQMGEPDMRTPIAYALGFPDRIAANVTRLDLARHATLTFEKPDPKRFPAMTLARQALEIGGSAPCVLNAANEIAVGAFLSDRIGFLEIVSTVEKALQQHAVHPLNSLEEVLEVDRETRIKTEELLA